MSETTAAPLYSKGYRAWLLTVLLLTNAMNLADRQGIAAVAQAVKIDLKFSDSQMGLLQGLAFAIFYSAVRPADRAPGRALQPHPNHRRRAVGLRGHGGPVWHGHEFRTAAAVSHRRGHRPMRASGRRARRSFPITIRGQARLGDVDHVARRADRRGCGRRGSPAG